MINEILIFGIIHCSRHSPVYIWLCLCPLSWTGHVCRKVQSETHSTWMHWTFGLSKNRLDCQDC